MRPIKAREQLAIPDEGNERRESLFRIELEFVFLSFASQSQREKSCRSSNGQTWQTRPKLSSCPCRYLHAQEKSHCGGEMVRNQQRKCCCSHDLLTYQQHGQGCHHGEDAVVTSRIRTICLALHSRVTVTRCVRSTLTFPSTLS